MPDRSNCNHLYVLFSARGRRRITKIGITSDPKKRIGAAMGAIGAPRHVKLVHQEELSRDAWVIEWCAKKLVVAEQYWGEWFRCEPEDMLAAILEAKRIVAESDFRRWRKMEIPRSFRHRWDNPQIG